MERLMVALEAWRAEYGPVESDEDGHRWMSQYDHGSDQYEKVMDLAAAYDALTES